MHRYFVREKTEQEPEVEPVIREKIKIGVLSMSKGAGATFVATSLAKMISKDRKIRTTYVELAPCNSTEASRPPLLYDALGMDQRFSGRNFHSFYDAVLKGSPVRGLMNLDEGINWAIRTPEDINGEISLTEGQLLRLLNNVSGDLIICDLGMHREALVSETDLLVLVIDPLPSGLMAGKVVLEGLGTYRRRGGNVLFMINKMNPGVNRKELQNFLRIKPEVELPFIGSELFYRAQFSCKIPFALHEVRNIAEKPLHDILLSLETVL